MKRIEKPWGHELIWAHTQYYVGKILFIKAGEALSYQYHEKKEESIYLAQGTMDFEYDDGSGRKIKRMQVGDSFHVTVGLKHRMIAVEDCQVFEASTPHLDDVVRLEDRYKRD